MAQSSMPFVPLDFTIPDPLETLEFKLRMLTVNDVVRDYDAVMTSVEHLRTVWPGSQWPEGLTLEQDLIDLGWHQREFQTRRSFAYIVVTPSESQVLGCVYIDPSRQRAYDAEIYLWVRQSELAGGLETRLYVAVKAWVENAWPFKRVAYPGRDVTWDDWRATTSTFVRPQPLVCVNDVEASSRWYQQLLGCRSAHGGPNYERLEVDGQLVMQLHRWEEEHHHGPIGDRHDPSRGNGVLLWFEVEDFEGAMARAAAMGTEVVLPRHRNPPDSNGGPNHWECWLRDPDGYTVVLASPDGTADGTWKPGPQ